MQPQQLEKRIEELRQEFAGYQPLPQDVQEKLDKKFRLEFNYNSNHIEGNTLTYGETQLLLFFGKTEGQHDIREYEEMKGSDVALKMVQEYAADKERGLTEGFIKDLNKIILVRPYWANAITADGQATRREISIGDYKKHPNSVRLQSGEMFHYASPEETPALMGDLVAWYKEELEKNELHPIALAALLHYKFVRIHPFDDGNGRISRLLMNYVLYYHGLPPIIIKSANKKDYLFALNQADTGNVNAFVAYVAQQMLWSLDIVIKAAKGESIEEQDDLEKEISVWKKETYNTKKEKSQIIMKSARVLNEIYYEQFSPLKTLFLQRMNVFRELFEQWQQKTVVSDVDIPYQYLSEEEIQRRIDSLFGDPFGGQPENPTNIEKIYSVGIEIKMDRFKASIHPITIDVELKIYFDAWEYEIVISNSRGVGEVQRYIRTYGEVFSQNEQQSIINASVKSVFDFLKLLKAAQ